MNEREECLVCGHSMESRLHKRYETRLLGFPVTLNDTVVEHYCPECEEGSIEIPAIEELEYALALARVLYPLRLSGEEVRTLRGILQMPAKEFADVLDVAAASLSRWENGRQAIGTHAEKVLRMYVCGEMVDKAPGIAYHPHAIPRMTIQDAYSAVHPVMERSHSKPECGGTACYVMEPEVAAA